MIDKEVREMSNTGEFCPICKRPIGSYNWCSEFCERVNLPGKDAFKNLKKGDWGFWPCAECGCVVEDEYVPDGCCSQCAPKRTARIRADLLAKLLGCASLSAPTSTTDVVYLVPLELHTAILAELLRE
jgi:hypothetical protein